MSFLTTKRLLKDLPFLDAGVVMVQCNGTYRIHRGETIYSGNLNSSSSNGVCDLDKKEKEIVDEIWDNPKWFEEAVFSEPKWKVGEKEITIYFDKSVDADELLTVAKMVNATLKKNWKNTIQEYGQKDYINIF